MTSPWTAPGSRPEGHDQHHPKAGDQQQPVAGDQPPQRELVQRVPMFPLRPLGVGEILGAAVRIYRSRPKDVFALTALVYGVAFVLLTLVTGVGMIPVLADLQALADNPAADPDTSTSAGDVLGTVWTSVGSGVITIVATQLVALALSRLVVDEARGAPLSSAGMWSLLRRRGLAAVLLGLLVGVLAAVPVILVPLLGGIPLLVVREAHWWTIVPLLAGVLLGLIGAFYVMMRLILAVPALASEDIGAVRALRRALELTKGRRFWRVLGVGVLLLAIFYLAQQAIAAVFGVVGFVAYLGILFGTGLSQIVLGMVILMIITMIGAYVGTVVVLPFYAAGIAALYADARMRHEAWDVELSGAVARQGDAAGTAAPYGGVTA